MLTKLTALLFLTTTSTVFAEYQPNIHEERAGCEIKSSRSGGLSGMIEFTESVTIDRKNGGKMRTETKMYSTWTNAQAHETHSLAIVNDDHRHG